MYVITIKEKSTPFNAEGSELFYGIDRFTKNIGFQTNIREDTVLTFNTIEEAEEHFSKNKASLNLLFGASDCCSLGIREITLAKPLEFGNIVSDNIGFYKQIPKIGELIKMGRFMCKCIKIDGRTIYGETLYEI